MEISKDPIKVQYPLTYNKVCEGVPTSGCVCATRAVKEKHSRAKVWQRA